MAVNILLARRFTLTPEVGHATGSVRTDVLTSLGTTPGGDPITQRSRIVDSLSGWWLAAGLSLSF